MSLLPTTELEGVNDLLLAISEAPVNTLSGELPTDVTIAKRILDSVNRKVQGRGWHFNTEYNVTIALDSDSQIVLGASVVSATSISKNVTIREGKLYDIDERTFTFTAALTNLTTITLLAFTDIPQSARIYIVELGKRQIQQEVNGSVSADIENRETLLRLLGDLRDDEITRSKPNMGTGTIGMFNMLHRDRLVY